MRTTFVASKFFFVFDVGNSNSGFRKLTLEVRLIDPEICIWESELFTVRENCYLHL